MYENNLTMVVTQGLFLIGVRIAGDELKDPRVVTVTDNGTKVNLSPLPALPPVVIFPSNSLVYGIPKREDTLYKLYSQVTAPGVDPNNAV